MIKNHPFRNGNKRIAVASLFVVLYLNKLWLSTKPLGLRDLAEYVSTSDRKNKSSVVMKISRFTAKNITKF